MQDSAGPITSASGGEAVPSLREILQEASEPIAHFWPMRRFIHHNPLHGLEHLPFDEAIARARLLLGGRGYLADEEYRSFVRQGRMTKDDVAEALRRVGPYTGAKATIRIGGKAIRPEDVLLVHMLHGIEPLDPVLLNWHLDHGRATTRFRSDVPPDARQRILARLRQTSPSHALNGNPDPEATYLETLWSTILTAIAPPELPSSTLADAPLHEPRESVARASHDDPPFGPTPHQTVGEWLGRLTGVDLVERINDQVIKWCAPFVDEGLASWSMPSRERGLYLTWRDLAGRDRSWQFWGVPEAARHLRALPEQPDEAVVATLRRLGVPQERWTEYLSRHLAQLPGWAGFLRWRSDNPAYHQHRVAPLHLLEYVAIRLFYEAELVAAKATRLWQTEGTLPALLAYVEGRPELRRASAALVPGEGAGLHSGHRAASETPTFCRDAWRLFHLAQFLAVLPQDLAQADRKDLRALLEVLDAYPSDQHGPVWLEAYEDRYRRTLLAKLARSGGSQEPRAGRPKAQAVFCIDVRSESFRRHLEAQGPYETFGFAGFFGVPICYRGFDSEEDVALCPVLLTPKHAVQEVPRPDQAEPLRLGLAGSRWRAFGRHLLHELKSHPVASYVVYDLISFLFALGLVGKTVAKRPYQRWLNGIRQRFLTPVATQITVGSRNGSETPGAPAPDSGGGPAPELAQGFEIAEQATFVEGG
ncbi:MAG: putative inorganic carbon transporter subunit DabA, partial [Nitrospirales bacterium]